MKNIKMMAGIILTCSVLVSCNGIKDDPNAWKYGNMYNVQDYVVVGKDFSQVEHTHIGPIPNDITGRWRVMTTNENIQMKDYAVDYYRRHFTDDNEVHFVVNYNNNTTTRIISIVGVIIEINVHERTSGDGTDAKKIANGMHYATYHVDVETGSIEKIR